LSSSGTSPIGLNFHSREELESEFDSYQSPSLHILPHGASASDTVVLEDDLKTRIFDISFASAKYNEHLGLGESTVGSFGSNFQQ